MTAQADVGARLLGRIGGELQKALVLAQRRRAVAHRQLRLVPGGQSDRQAADLEGGAVELREVVDVHRHDADVLQRDGDGGFLAQRNVAEVHGDGIDGQEPADLPHPGAPGDLLAPHDAQNQRRRRPTPSHRHPRQRGHLHAPCQAPGRQAGAARR
jgi:hypothetical protein